MMMAGGVAEHKRIAAEAFLMLNREGGGAAHRRGGAGAAAASHCGGAAGAKRPRNSSCETGASMSLRERKDKIGDRVAALQQLVSPFGKTDTASVLHEATGYINFLHDQLEVLSAPYLRASLVDSQESTCSADHYSLRSRGLCLVPVECTLKLAGSNGADMWAPTNTNTGTRNL